MSEMSEINGEPLGRLPGRFWADTPPEREFTGEDRPFPSVKDPQGTSPLSLSPVSSSPSRNLSSSAESRGALIWRKKYAQANSDRMCVRTLDCTSWDVASPEPSPASPQPPQMPTRWRGVKIPVLAPSTFVEHIITASEWTRVDLEDAAPSRPRRRRRRVGVNFKQRQRLRYGSRSGVPSPASARAPRLGPHPIACHLRRPGNLVSIDP
jgi:hypothetical protein